MKYTDRQTENFWSHVIQGDPDDCWPWSLSKITKGYGQVGMRIDGKFRNLRTHRVAWELTNGEIKDDLHCLHKCDVRSCCNPNHLYLGTNYKNMQDMVSRNRQAKGETHGRAKLKEADVRRIKLRLDQFSDRILSLMYNVSPVSIYRIRNGITWAWL